MARARRNAFVLAVLAGLVLAAPACVTVVDDAVLTCDAFDRYLFDCYPECSVTVDCELYYDRLLPEGQNLLDRCADCLDANRFACLDCYAGNRSCHSLLEGALGVSCAW